MHIELIYRELFSILRGNLATGGCVSKITGKEGLTFEGKARVFDNEDAVGEAIRAKEITPDEKTVIVLRYLGPKGGPGMPEMLKTTSLVMGAGLGMDVACVTDGRFSGGTHGFTVGHVVPVRLLFPSSSEGHHSDTFFPYDAHRKLSTEVTSLW